MADKFEATNNRFVVTKNDKVAFDTAAPSVVQLTGAEIWKTDFVIEFPSYVQKKAYYRMQLQGGGPSLCELWSTLVWQEWGPDEPYVNERWGPGHTYHQPGPTRRTLGRQYLGSVPAQTSYLDIRVRLSRTASPPPWMGLESPMVLFQEGQWTPLVGGSCPTELIGTRAVRHFDIVRHGNDIFLERYQSVNDANTEAAPDGGAQMDISGAFSGWNSNLRTSEMSGEICSDGSILVPRSNFHLFNQLQRKGYDNDGNKRPGGTNSCSAGWSDLTSRFTGDLLITPGIYRP